MRKLDRTTVNEPNSLKTPSNSVATEAAEASAFYATKVPWSSHYTAYKFEAYRGKDVKDALRKLSNGKCAYCESKIVGTGAREVEHYRPKGGIKGVQNHPGYWWLAHDWENLLPTCPACNKSLRQHIVTPGMTRDQVEDLMADDGPSSHGKANQFEIQGQRAVSASCSLQAEDPLLIDPCRRDPGPELRWSWENGLSLVAPTIDDNGTLSPYGEFTIRACALNRAGLVLDRVAALSFLRNLRTQILNDLERWDGDQGKLDDLVARAQVLREAHGPDQQFAGMIEAFVDDLLEEFGRWLQDKGLPQPATS